MGHDTPVLVETTEEILSAADDVTGRDAEVAGQLLTDGAESVLWIQPWLADEKAISYAPGDVTVAEVSVEQETKDAWCVKQGGEEWVPKSQTVVFQTKPGVDRVESQQQRLG